MSAVALPPSSPGYQVSRIDSIFSSSHVNVNGLPFTKTSTTGFPVASTALINCRCTPGISKVAPSTFSPVVLFLFPFSCRFELSPTTRITASACFAIFTASAKPVVSISSCVQPCAYKTFVEGLTWFLTPSKTEII